MQITLNIPDDLPANIVHQYIKTIEAQMSLMSSWQLERVLRIELQV